MANDASARDRLLTDLAALRRDVNSLLDEVAKAIIGQDEVLRLMLA